VDGDECSTTVNQYAVDFRRCFVHMRVRQGRMRPQFSYGFRFQRYGCEPSLTEQFRRKVRVSDDINALHAMALKMHLAKQHAPSATQVGNQIAVFCLKQFQLFGGEFIEFLAEGVVMRRSLLVSAP